MGEAWIIDAVRTPRGRGKKDVGGLSRVHPQQLLGQVLQALQDRVGFNPAELDDVVAGCVSAVGEQSACIARNAVLAAGWDPRSTGGVTLNRFCGSGQQAVSFAAMGVMSGQQDLVIGSGIESMSRVPWGSAGGGLDGDDRELLSQYPLVPQGISADLIATLEGFSRQDVDRYALQSQRRAATAIETRRFDRSLVPVHDADGAVVLERDEHPRPDVTPEALARLRPAFESLGAACSDHGMRTVDEDALSVYPKLSRIEHVHTAGNSSGVVDGAAGVLVAAPEYARAHGLKPRARIVAMATAADEPVIMLTAPAPATRRCLKRAGMTLDDLDLLEINEAFAAIALKVMRDLDIDDERVNVNGGAIALGHPLGATGAMLLGTLLDELERRDATTGLVTMCIGGGMGIATVIERI
ncbi:MAG: acetyl-CoA C-acetyltransferase [Myxococcales bacterium]|nr:acetyl-CoA C-acetyltransferase [Myxococcales bacterium]